MLTYIIQAVFCFRKGKDNIRYDLANAYRLQQIAKSSENSSDVATIKQNFIAAAAAFKKCSRPIQEALCYEVNISVLYLVDDKHGRLKYYPPT